ncbi:hypothetical protein NDU88_001209 [Pleurodeles waltl]|uniref:Uncharacterized protein n=1 Tax=Pleurodeles waltl TaxID=8319 RepID=A0AAV7R928_PLEWA|nr:hypothetical protein NDU88_001209 [Pleurodeles waltl]
MMRWQHPTPAAAQERKMTCLRRSTGSPPNTARLWDTRRCSAAPLLPKNTTSIRKVFLNSTRPRHTRRSGVDPLHSAPPGPQRHQAAHAMQRC